MDLDIINDVLETPNKRAVRHTSTRVKKYRRNGLSPLDWQKRNVELGKCRLCNTIRTTSKVFCEYHLIKHRERQRKDYKLRKQCG